MTQFHKASYKTKHTCTHGKASCRRTWWIGTGALLLHVCMLLLLLRLLPEQHDANLQCLPPYSRYDSWCRTW
jgi:hypothetical protein